MQGQRGRESTIAATYVHHVQAVDAADHVQQQ
jgi:hypothetical protein